MEAAVRDNRRRKLGDMDNSIRGIVEALKASGQYDNTVIIFISDNGARGVTEPGAPNPNHPLRGSKGTVYEGGTRVPALVHSPAILGGRGRGGRGYPGLLHMVDILPTLLTLAGGEGGGPGGLDGVSQWEAIARSDREEVNNTIYRDISCLTV